MKGGRWRPSWRPDGLAPTVAVAKVRAVILGFVSDPTGGAKCFHRAGTWVPPWAPNPKKWKLIGVHFFYKEKGLTRNPKHGKMGSNGKR
jgi:spore germination cell wall hydrolase CwlJ-like protein